MAVPYQTTGLPYPASNEYPLDFHLEVARKNVSGMDDVGKFGRNIEIDIGNTADIWDGGNQGNISLIWVPPTTARAHVIASTNANDTDGGTGLRTVRVYGLTAWDGDFVSEDLTMNTGTPPTTINDYVIIHRMQALTWGSAGPNIGVVTATANTDATVTALMRVGEGQSQMAIFGVPGGRTAYMTRLYANLNRNGGSATGGMDVALKLNPIPDSQLLGYITKHTFSVNMAGTSAFSIPHVSLRVYDGPCILKIQATSDTNNLDLSAGFDLTIE